MGRTKIKPAQLRDIAGVGSVKTPQKHHEGKTKRPTETKAFRNLDDWPEVGAGDESPGGESKG